MVVVAVEEGAKSQHDYVRAVLCCVVRCRGPASPVLTDTAAVALPALPALPPRQPRALRNGPISQQVHQHQQCHRHLLAWASGKLGHPPYQQPQASPSNLDLIGCSEGAKQRVN